VTSFDWQSRDPGGEALVFVGPVMTAPLLAREMQALGLGAAPQIAVDGGVDYALAPILWAGDGDSGAGRKADVVKDNQDETDLRFCLNGVRGWRWRQLHLFGFLGGRRDHELANFGEVQAELLERKNFESAVFYDDAREVALRFFSAGTNAVNLAGSFSVLVLAPATISVSGDCEYQVQGAQLAPLSGRGVSNRAHGTVQVTGDAPFMVVRG